MIPSWSPSRNPILSKTSHGWRRAGGDSWVSPPEPEDSGHSQPQAKLPTLTLNYPVVLEQPHSQPIEFPPTPQHKPAPQPVHNHTLPRVLIDRSEGSNNPPNHIAL